MKRLLLSMLLLGLVAQAWATDPAPGDFDSKFVQTRKLPGFSTPLVSYGVLRFDRARGFHWEITDPYHYAFDMNGDAASETLPDGTSRKLDPAQTPWLAAVRHIIVTSLSGDREGLARYFDISVTPLAKGERVDLKPKSGPMAEAILAIHVTESAPGHPLEIAIDETSGDRMDIRFTSSAP